MYGTVCMLPRIQEDRPFTCQASHAARRRLRTWENVAFRPDSPQPFENDGDSRKAMARHEKHDGHQQGDAFGCYRHSRRRATRRDVQVRSHSPSCSCASSVRVVPTSSLHVRAPARQVGTFLYRSTPWHLRFGKMNLLKPKEKVVKVPLRRRLAPAIAKFCMLLMTAVCADHCKRRPHRNRHEIRQRRPSTHARTPARTHASRIHTQAHVCTHANEPMQLCRTQWGSAGFSSWSENFSFRRRERRRGLFRLRIRKRRRWVRPSFFRAPKADRDAYRSSALSSMRRSTAVQSMAWRAVACRRCVASSTDVPRGLFAV